MSCTKECYYVFRIGTKKCYYVFRVSTFDAEAVKAACSIFVGHKDFTALCSKSINRDGTEKSSIREVRSLELVKAEPFISNTTLSEEFDFWHFTCSARSFLYHQVQYFAFYFLYNKKKRRRIFFFNYVQ